MVNLIQDWEFKDQNFFDLKGRKLALLNWLGHKKIIVIPAWMSLLYNTDIGEIGLFVSQAHTSHFNLQTVLYIAKKKATKLSDQTDKVLQKIICIVSRIQDLHLICQTKKNQADKRVKHASFFKATWIYFCFYLAKNRRMNRLSDHIKDLTRCCYQFVSLRDKIRKIEGFSENQLTVIMEAFKQNEEKIKTLSKQVRDLGYYADSQSFNVSF